MKKLVLSALSVFALFCVTHSLHAAAPDSAVQHTPGEINYQGKLVKTDGNTVTDGAYTLAIRLWRVPTGGTTPVWGGQYVTYVKGGYFNLMLGGAAGSAVSPTPTYAHNALWRALWPDPAIPSDQKNSLYLGVTPVSGAVGLTYNVEISPRQNLLAAPYAFRAQTAEYANQSIGNFTVNGAFSAGFEPNSAIAFRTYKSGSAPFLDIGVNGSGETKLQSGVTRVTSSQFTVTSGTQSFTAGAGNFAVNSGAGNINLSGNTVNMNMTGNVNISGAGNAGTTVGIISRPLVLKGSEIGGLGPLRWNKISSPSGGAVILEKPFIVEEFSFIIPAGDSYETIDLGRSVRDYSAMVVGWTANTSFTTHTLETAFYEADGNWQLRVGRTPSTGNVGYRVTILFINRQMVDDSRTVLQQG